MRQARSIESRVERGVELGFGKIEHVVVSVSPEDYLLRETALRKKCRNALFDRDVVGGCMIFHGFRIDRERECLVWSPHYYVWALLRVVLTVAVIAFMSVGIVVFAMFDGAHGLRRVCLLCGTSFPPTHEDVGIARARRLIINSLCTKYAK